TKRHARRFVYRRIDNARQVSRQVTTWLALVALLTAGVGLQMVWSQNDYKVEAPSAGGTYVEGALGPINNLNPLFASSSAENSVAGLVFSSLYDYDSTGHLRQDLARSMQVDKGQNVYTITLKKGVKWQDGKPLTAADVVYTVNLIKSPEVGSPLRVNWLDVAVVAVDSNTVKFTLPAVYAAFPHALTFPIVPKHILSAIPPENIRQSAFSSAPVGSGPFMFHRIQNVDALGAEKVVRLDANKSYFRGAPKLARFELHSYTTDDLLMKAINAGELSGATDVPVTSVGDISSNKFHSTALVLDSGVYLLINMQSDILKDQVVRKALQVGTDTVEIRRQLGGDVLPLDGPLLNSQFVGADAPHAPKFDLNKAKQILDDGGWKVGPDGERVKDGKKLQFTIVTTQSKEYGEVLTDITDQWTKLGVKVDSQAIDTASASSTFVHDVLQSRNFDILLYKLAIGADPDVFAYWHSSQIDANGFNFSSYSNPLADANLASARARLDPALRQAKYRQFVAQWLQDVPAIGLYQPVVEYASSAKVSSVSQGERLVTGADRYADVLYWSSLQGSVYKTP
ncbi:MAG: peptide ABC transporter substrate-binding protein, partial [Candidatus Saccharimonas sp.]